MKKEEFDIRSTLQIAIEMAKKTEWHKGTHARAHTHTPHTVGVPTPSLPLRVGRIDTHNH
jgi:hypothetical protein